jgi:hypothetical protein
MVKVTLMRMELTKDGIGTLEEGCKGFGGGWNVVGLS